MWELSLEQDRSALSPAANLLLPVGTCTFSSLSSKEVEQQNLYHRIGFSMGILWEYFMGIKWDKVFTAYWVSNKNGNYYDFFHYS